MSKWSRKSNEYERERESTNLQITLHVLSCIYMCEKSLSPSPTLNTRAPKKQETPHNGDENGPQQNRRRTAP